MSATTIVVNDESPRRQYTASASQTEFDFPLPFFNNDDLTVYLTPVGQAPDDNNDLLTITTDYTVSGANTQDSGLVTLTTGATSGDIITIERIVDIERISDFQTGGDLTAETINREQDTEIFIAQQLRQNINRGIRFQATSATQSALLVAEPNTGKGLIWDANGNLINTDDNVNDIVSDATSAKNAAETAQTGAETAQANAETAQANAETAEANAAASFDAFDDRYLGDKSSDPSQDNDGNALLDGALYWNTTVPEMRVYNLGSTTWEPAANITKASKTQAETGTDDAAYMTPLKTAQAISAQVQIVQSDVRQTVNTGPVDSNGRADFLSAGTGLEAVTTGFGTTPLNVALGDGFGANGKVDLSVEVNSNLTFSSLTDNDVNYLYVEYDAGTETLSTGSITLDPVYSPTRPSSPSTDQYWYPTDHRSRGEYWDGSAWQPVLRVFIGQAETSGGSVVDVKSYAYQGFFIINGATGGMAASTVYTHSAQIGVAGNLQDSGLLAECRVANNGYEVGDIINLDGDNVIGSSTSGSGYVIKLGSNISQVTTSTNVLGFIPDTGGFTAGGLPYASFSYHLKVARSF